MRESASSKEQLNDQSNNVQIQSQAILYAFDFDHTIVDGNSDLVVMDLDCGFDNLPQEVMNLRKECWTSFMNAVFRYLHSKGVTLEEMKEKVGNIPATQGMIELLQKIREHLAQNPGSKLLIASDANDIFISTFFSLLEPPMVPDFVITNQSKVDIDGLLQIEPYENQSQCSLCPRNLCKGIAIMKYVDGNGPFSKILYFGDSSNDLCPSVKLSKGDIVFPRKGFKLDKLLLQEEKTFNQTQFEVKAEIVPWDNAELILKYVS